MKKGVMTFIGSGTGGRSTAAQITATGKKLLRLIMVRKCDLCGERDLMLYSDGVGIMACEPCWEETD